MLPFFSIVVPVYNANQFIRKCIDSIINQSLNKWELILVDDGSIDGSQNICDEYAASYSSVVVIHKKNEGVAIARAVGCNKATGKYVLFVDSDDWLAPDCLEIINSILVSTNVDIVRFGYYRDDGYGNRNKVLPKKKGLYNRKKIQKELFPSLIHNDKAEYYLPAIWCSAFLRESILPYMIKDKRATIGEDGACVIPSIANADSIWFIDEPLYFYRYNPNSATNGHRAINWDNPMVIATHIANNVDLSMVDFEDQLNRKVVHDVFNVCISAFFSNKRYVEVARDIKTILDYESYNNAIHNAVFRPLSKAWFMQFSLKHKVIWLLYLFSKSK